jgi:hypothetical protein
MSFDLKKILESKRALRRHLAAQPGAEKLRMLDALRERELAIRGSAAHSDSGTLHEEPSEYRTPLTAEPAKSLAATRRTVAGRRRKRRKGRKN